MAVLEKCLEKATALSIGACLLAFHVEGGAELAELAVATAGLAGIVLEVTRRHGPESRAHINKLTREVRARLSVDLGDLDRAQLTEAAKALTPLLTTLYPDKDRLAQLSIDPRGFPTAATEEILGRIAAQDERFASGLWAQFAGETIHHALAAAFDDLEYFKHLEPKLWREAMAAFGRIEQKLDRVLDMMPLAAKERERLKAKAMASIDPATADAVLRRLSDCISRLDSGSAKIAAAAAAIDGLALDLAQDRGVKRWAIATAAGIALVILMVGFLIWRQGPTTAEAQAADLKALNGRWGEAGCAKPYEVKAGKGVITLTSGDWRSMGTVVAVEGGIIKSETLEPAADRGKSVWLTLSHDPAHDYLTLNDRKSDTSVRWERCP